MNSRPWTSKSTREIPVLVPTVPNYRRLKKYLKKIDRNRTYSNFGPLNSSLITRASEYFSVSEELIQTCTNATVAIEGAIRTSGAKEDVWELPSWTFAATASALLNSNSQGRFVDVNISTWRANFSSDVRNVIDVLPFGDDLDLNRIPSSVECVVIDGAASIHALESFRLQFDRPISVIISLHATKSLPAGEGALFITNDPIWSEKFRRWTNFGFDNNRNSAFIGTNAKLSEYAAAVALASFDELITVRNRMLDLGEIARRVSQDMDLEVHPALKKGMSTPYWIAVLKDENARNVFESRLQTSRIMTRHWWGSGCHNQLAFNEIRRKRLEITDHIARTTLGIPFHLGLRKQDLRRIIGCAKV